MQVVYEAMKSKVREDAEDLRMADIDSKQVDTPESKQFTSTDSHEVDNLAGFRNGSYAAEINNVGIGSTKSNGSEHLPALLLHDNSNNSLADQAAATPGDASPRGTSAEAAKAAGDETQFVSASTTDSTTAAKGDDGGWHRFWGESPDPQDINTGRRALGTNLMNHLNDWDYLIDHRQDLQRGLEEAYSHMTPQAFQRFVGELNRRSGGNIYMEHGNGILGSLNPLNPPGNQVVRVYLHRGGLIPDNCVMDSRDQTSSPVYTSGSPFDSRR